MAIAGTNISLDSTEGMDKITQTEKVTTPYFSDGSTTVLGASIVSSSLTDTNEGYFFGISNTTTPTVEEFNVAFGSTRGYGVSLESNTKSETEAIYKQYASLLLAPTEVTGGFIISSGGSGGVVTGRDEEIYVLSARRSNMKDRLNKGTWTIALSGSVTAGGSAVAGMADGATLLELTDDSVNDTPTATPVGDRYNIVSGSGGTVHTAATTKNYGFFYPDMGVLVFSAAELSASIPGSGSTANMAAVTTFQGNNAVANTHRGLGYYKATAVDTNTALRFVNCLQAVGTKLSFRDEEDQVSAQYFCRVRAAHCNFSTNPTFVSGSLNELRHTSMKGNPNVFITAVQLYNTSGDMVGIGHLSTPLKKNFTSEATIKVKLTY